MKSARFAIVLALLSSSAPALASASEYAFLAQRFFAREVLRQPSQSQAPADTQAPSESALWQTSAWSDWSSTCSDNAIRTRAVTCQVSGQIVGDEECTDTRPTSSEAKPNYSSCAYRFDVWKRFVTPTGTNANRCEANEPKNVSSVYGCIKTSDMTIVADSYCTDQGLSKPATVTTTVSCTKHGSYDWGYTTYNNAGRHKIFIFDGIITDKNQRMRLFVETCRALRAQTGSTATCESQRTHYYSADNKTGIEVGFIGATETPVHPYANPTSSYNWAQSFKMTRYEYDLRSVPEPVFSASANRLCNYSTYDGNIWVTCVGEPLRGQDALFPN